MRSSASARRTPRSSLRALEAEGIVTSERDGNLRVSAHAYNTADDIDAVLAALARHRALLTALNQVVRRRGSDLRSAAPDIL